MRIGVTSQNFRTITAHAGRARRFVIFEDFPNGQIQETGKLDLPMEMSIHEYPRNAAHPIDGLDVLITASCGDGFARKLGERGIRVIVTSETDPIAAVKAVLSGAPLPPAAAEEEEDRGGCGCNCSGGNH
jgi:predicted Fe-Mo cluster-binding NifX family protein